MEFGQKELKAIGFSIHHTGGGCMAYIKSINKTKKICITDSSGCCLPVKGDIMVGVVEEVDGEYGWAEEDLANLEAKSLKQAITWIKKQEKAHE